MSTPDSILLERWQRRRDPDAFTELVQRHSGMVFSCCKRILGDRMLAEDVSQECFMALLQSRDRVRASLGAWLHTIAVRRSIDWIKSDARRRNREAVFAEKGEGEVTTDPSLEEILAVVDAAIAELPEPLRAAVVGRFLENLTHAELARRLEIAESTVRFRVGKGVDRIRRKLGGQGISVGAATLATVLGQTAEAAPASLTVRLGKLAVSGSLSVPVGAGIGTLLTAKIAAFVLAAALLGAGIWMVVQRPGQGNSASLATAPPSTPQPEQTADTPASGRPELSGAPQTSPGRDQATLAANLSSIGSVKEPEPFSIQGRIYDAKTGEGIAGVRANVYPAGGGAYVGRSEPTGEDGHYSIPPVKDGMYSVNLGDIEGYPDPRGSRHISVLITNSEPVTGIDFALERGLPVSGMVIGSDGKPVAGAEVAAAIPTTPNAIRTTTDEQGKFTLYMPEISDQLRVQAQNERAESGVEGTFVLREDGLEGVVLMLDRPKTASVSGTVIDASGNPMAGAQLHLFRKDGSVLRNGNPGETGPDGQFKITGIPSAEYAVVVTPKGVTSYSTAEEYLRIHPATGETLEGIEIVYGEKGGMALAGRVIDSQGHPIARALVSCFAGGAIENAHTGEDGTFMVTGLEDTMCSLSVQHDQYSRASGQFPAGTTDAEIVLKRRGLLAGRVVRADTGEPLAKYSLAYVMGEVSELDEMLFGSGMPIESADGTFSIGKTQVGRLSIAAWAPGFAPKWRYVDVEEDRATDVELRLTPVPPFEGTVVNEAGEPIPDAAVYFVTGVSVDRMDRAAATHSDPQGRFVVDSLPVDAEHLCAYHPGYGVGVIRLPGENRIVLSEGADLTGTIHIEGVAMSDLFINATYPDANYLPSAHLKPEPDGTFRLAGMSAGLLRVDVVPNAKGNPRSLTKTIQLEAGQETHVDLVFEPGSSRVEGIVSVDGVPTTSAYLALERQLGDTTETIRTTPGTDGSFHFDNVWPGNLVLRISRVDPQDPYEPIKNEVDLTVHDGQILRQDIDLPPLD